MNSEEQQMSTMSNLCHKLKYTLHNPGIAHCCRAKGQNFSNVSCIVCQHPLEGAHRKIGCLVYVVNVCFLINR